MKITVSFREKSNGFTKKEVTFLFIKTRWKSPKSTALSALDDLNAFSFVDARKSHSFSRSNRWTNYSLDR